MEQQVVLRATEALVLGQRKAVPVTVVVVPRQRKAVSVTVVLVPGQRKAVPVKVVVVVVELSEGWNYLRNSLVVTLGGWGYLQCPTALFAVMNQEVALRASYLD